MGTSVRRSIVWLFVATLAIAAAAFFASGFGAASNDAGAPPTTGQPEPLAIEITENVETGPVEVADTATVTVRKVFEGPESWEFGFAIVCSTTPRGEIQFFPLGGGESETFTVEFPLELPLEVTDDQVPVFPEFICQVGEEALLGDWVVEFAVDGSEIIDSISDQIGTAIIFGIEPGDELVVTFTNIPGYAAQPPTGVFTIPPPPPTNR